MPSEGGAAVAVVAAVVLAAVRGPEPPGVIAALLSTGWLAVTVAAARAGRPGLARVAAVVTALQAAVVAMPALGPLVVVAWAWVLLALPHGRLASTGRRAIGTLLVAGALGWSAALATAGLDTAAPAGALAGAMAGCAALTGFVGAARADQQARWTLLWAAAGGLIAVACAGVAGALLLLVGTPARPMLPALAGTLALPLGLAAGVWPRTAGLAPRALSGALVVAGLTVLADIVYLVIVIGLGHRPVGGERTVLGLSLVAALVTAALAWPARARLADAAERALRSVRPSPQELLTTFSARMTRAVPMDELLLQLAELLRATMGLAGAEVWTGTEAILARTVSVPERPPATIELSERQRTVVAQARAAGTRWLAIWIPDLLTGPAGTGAATSAGAAERAPGHSGVAVPADSAGAGVELVRAVPVTHFGELLGLLVVRRPPTGPPFTAQDDRILAELARPVGLALHNISLDTALQASLAQLQERNAELQASRARIIGAADASRRRIERDLHDGAQQHLFGVSVKLGMAEQIIAADPTVTGQLLAELRRDVQTATAALRELAHGIYPPLLRDHGLAPALRAAAARCPLECSVEVTTARYPSAVEAALYFCCVEALQNAAKHAGPGARVQVRVDADGEDFRFSVSDDGAGFDQAAVGGHGFVNMQDRLGAMGGTLKVVSAPGAGTIVRGLIPRATSEGAPAGSQA
ncbi:GAF domain-containing protein [Parafrankia irregularis]|uniref:histidine kinase n=1 Tax=Parafrankia irregularis TaxID=795642 RepID=A0A0S4QNY5_9ACTN|nr:MULTISPECIES: GAF domain-containing sensor histidine kinase [Parafrankia]MBE3201627.1 sensor histidine kinase [Parafrankia sp. CH37]CUU57367.1 GAF domain-containing protein [Parafrankia irregularis]